MTTTTILPEDEDPFNDLTDDPFNDDFEPLDRKLTFTENDIYFETLHNQEQGEYKVLKVGLEPFKNYISKLSQNVPEKKLGRFIEDSVQIQFFGNVLVQRKADFLPPQNKVINKLLNNQFSHKL